MAASETRHATCVAFHERAVLILGASGSGKSTLALQLMAFGCELVADDRVILRAAEGRLLACAPQSIRGMIEARGVGILAAEPCIQAEVSLVVDLDARVDERLPQRRFITLLGCELPLISRVEGPQFASAILQLLRTGWCNQ